MQLNNPFKTEDRLTYLYEYGCHNCGRSNAGLELHHILGRISSSIFNAILLCRDCHDKVKQSDTENKKFFKINFNFLLKNYYKPRESDWDFLRENAKKLGLSEL